MDERVKIVIGIIAIATLVVMLAKVDITAKAKAVGDPHEPQMANVLDTVTPRVSGAHYEPGTSGPVR